MIQNKSEFVESISHPYPPEIASVYLKALWYDGKDEWQTAHEIIQEVNDKSAYRIHAYLHRKEGDITNACYWYSRAGKQMPLLSLQEEWNELIDFFINEQSTA